MCKTDEDCHGILPGSEIPNWISHQAMGSLVSFCVPPFLDGRKSSKVLLCIVYAANKEAPELGDWSFFQWRLCYKSSRDQSNDWYTVGKCKVITRAPDFDVFEDHIHAQVFAGLNTLWCEPNRMKMKSGDEIEVAIDLIQGGRDYMCGIDPQIVEVKRCGIHFVLDDDEISESEVKVRRIDDCSHPSPNSDHNPPPNIYMVASSHISLAAPFNFLILIFL